MGIAHLSYFLFSFYLHISYFVHRHAFSWSPLCIFFFFSSSYEEKKPVQVNWNWRGEWHRMNGTHIQHTTCLSTSFFPLHDMHIRQRKKIWSTSHSVSTEDEDRERVKRERRPALPFTNFDLLPRRKKKFPLFMKLRFGYNWVVWREADSTLSKFESKAQTQINHGRSPYRFLKNELRLRHTHTLSMSHHFSSSAQVILSLHSRVECSQFWRIKNINEMIDGHVWCGF